MLKGIRSGGNLIWTSKSLFLNFTRVSGLVIIMTILVGVNSAWNFQTAFHNLATVLVFNQNYFNQHLTSIKILFLLGLFWSSGKLILDTKILQIKSNVIATLIGSILNSFLIFSLSINLGIRASNIIVSFASLIALYFQRDKVLTLCRDILHFSSRNFFHFSSYVLCYLILAPVALKPELAFDATLYHIASAESYVKLDQFANLYKITSLLQNGIPNFNSVLQVQAILIAGIQGATLLSMFQLFGVLLLLRKILQDRFNIRLSYLYDFILLAIPIFSWSGVHGYSDMLSALVLLTILYLFLDPLLPSYKFRISLFAFLVGFSYAVKFSAFLYSALLLMFFLSKTIMKGSGFRKNLTATILGLLSGVLPVFGWSLWTSGNPIFPYFTQLIPTYGYTPKSRIDQNFFFANNPDQLDLLGVILFPFKVGLNQNMGEGYIGLLGFIVIFSSFYLLPFIKNSRVNELSIVNLLWIFIMVFGLPLNFRYFVAVFPILWITLVVTTLHLKSKLAHSSTSTESWSIALLCLSLVYSPLFVNTTTRDGKIPGLIGPLEYDYSYSNREYKIETLLENTFPALRIVNSRLKSNDVVLDLSGLERISMYLHPFMFTTSQWTSPLNNGQISYTDVDFFGKLEALGITYILADKAHLGQLPRDISYQTIPIDIESDDYFLFKLK